MRHSVFLLLVLIATCWSLPGMAETADTGHPAAAMVIDFNQAINDENIDSAMALLADGGVQFHLHPAHPGMAEDPPLTEDMATMWKTVSAILFPTTEAYVRAVEISDVQVDGELAVVWTQTTTTTRRKGAEPMVLEFSEMYFLVNKDGTGWKIAGTATNRPVDSIAVG